MCDGLGCVVVTPPISFRQRKSRVTLDDVRCSFHKDRSTCLSWPPFVWFLEGFTEGVRVQAQVHRYVNKLEKERCCGFPRKSSGNYYISELLHACESPVSGSLQPPCEIRPSALHTPRGLYAEMVRWASLTVGWLNNEGAHCTLCPERPLMSHMAHLIPAPCQERA